MYAPEFVPPRAPVTVDVIVGQNGTVCSLSFSKDTDPRLLSALTASMSKWVFWRPVANGKVLCTAMRVLVYLRRTTAGFRVVVPGLNAGDVGETPAREGSQ